MNWNAVFSKLKQNVILQRIVAATILKLLMLFSLLSNNLIYYGFIIIWLFMLTAVFYNTDFLSKIYASIWGLYVVYYLLLLFLILISGIYSTEITIHLENQKVTQVNTTEYDEDGTWYLIESDNYPNMRIREGRDINEEGVYSRLSSLKVVNFESKDDSDTINKIDKINGKVGE